MKIVLLLCQNIIKKVVETLMCKVKTVSKNFIIFFNTRAKNTVSSAFNIHHKGLIFTYVNCVLLQRKARYTPPHTHTHTHTHIQKSLHHKFAFFAKSMHVLSLFLSLFYENSCTYILVGNTDQ